MVDRLDKDGEGAKVATLSKNLKQTVIAIPITRQRSGSGNPRYDPVIASPAPRSGDGRGNPFLNSTKTKPPLRRRSHVKDRPATVAAGIICGKMVQGSDGGRNTLAR